MKPGNQVKRDRRTAGRRTAGHRTAGHRTSGFTLVEVLVTLVLLAIVVPTAMMATTQALKGSESAKHHAEAAALAESQMAKLLSDPNWQSGAMSGDFGDLGPGYTWQAVDGDWIESGVQELDVTVSWNGENQTVSSYTLSTLVYQNTAASSSGSTTSGTSGGTTP